MKQNIKVQRFYSTNTSSRINIPYTLSIKAGLKFAKLLLDLKHRCDSELNLERKYSTNLQNIQFSCTLSDAQKLQLQHASVSDDSATYHGKKYKANWYLTAVENHQVKLFKIIKLVELCKYSFYILSSEIELKHFDYHFQSFEVGRYLNNLCLKPVEYFSSPPLHIYTSNNGKVYLRNKYL